MTTSKHFCLIPAKGASTRLKFKNILKINDKELIYFAINAALKSGAFADNVFVSTENEQIRQIAMQYGAKVPFLRDEKLARDPFGVEQVALDFMDKKPELKNFETIAIVLPTAPLITSEDIRSAYAMYVSNGSKYLMSVTEDDHSALRSVFLRDNIITPVLPQFIKKKSQELEPTFRINGAVTIMDVKDFLVTKTYFGYPMAAYIMPRERSVDVDTAFDLELARYLYQAQHRNAQP